jgi:hypothetical protein
VDQAIDHSRLQVGLGGPDWGRPRGSALASKPL